MLWIVMPEKTLESPLDSKEIKPGNPKGNQPWKYSLEGVLLKLQLQSFGPLMWRANSLEKTLMLGKIEGRRRRGWQRMRWLDRMTDSKEMNSSKPQERVEERGVWRATWGHRGSDMTEQQQATTRKLHILAWLWDCWEDDQLSRNERNTGLSHARQPRGSCPAPRRWSVLHRRELKHLSSPNGEPASALSMWVSMNISREKCTWRGRWRKAPRYFLFLLLPEDQKEMRILSVEMGLWCQTAIFWVLLHEGNEIQLFSDFPSLNYCFFCDSSKMNESECLEWKFCSRHPCLFFNASALEINHRQKKNEKSISKIQVCVWVKSLILVSFLLEFLTKNLHTHASFPQNLWCLHGNLNKRFTFLHERECSEIEFYL